jgi:hypothetical protein
LPLTDILPEVPLTSSLSSASKLGLPVSILTPRSDKNDSDNEFLLITTCSGPPFFSVGLEMLELSSLDELDCVVDEEAVIKMRIETAKEGGAS